MKQKLLFLMLVLIGLVTNQRLKAQTLTAGDIAFVGYHTDVDDGFTFITLKDIPAGEVIYFTDKGWNATDATWYANDEDHIVWTAPGGGLSIGTVVSIIETSPDTFTVSQGTAVLSGSDTAFSLLGGDSILAYQSSSGAEPANPTFIAGIYGDDNYVHTLGCDDAGGWHACATCTHISGPCTTTSTSTTSIPAGLINGENALALFPTSGEKDNAKYTGTLTGSVSTVRAAINDHTNWNSSDDPINIASTEYSGINITPDATSCAPAVGITDFTGLYTTFTSLATGTGTATATVECFDFTSETVNPSHSARVGGTSVNGNQLLIIQGTGTNANLARAIIKSSDNSEFSFKSIKVQPFGSFTDFDITYTGYKDDALVSGASFTRNNLVSGTMYTDTFASIPGFSNVDEIRIEFTVTGTTYQNFRIDDVEIGSAVSVSVPDVSTSAVSSITSSGATFSGEVSADGGAAVTDRGFVYATTANPTTSDTKVQDGSGTGTFSEAITGLSASTTYYVRAYAINSTGTSYGNEVSFNTFSAFQLPTPTVSFDSPSAFTSNFSTAQSGGLASYAPSGGINNTGTFNTGAITSAQIWTFHQPFSPTLNNWRIGAFMEGIYITAIGVTTKKDAQQDSGRPTNDAITAYRPHIALGGGDTDGGSIGIYNTANLTTLQTGVNFNSSWKYWDMEVTYLGSSQYSVTARIFSANSNGTLASTTPLVEQTTTVTNVELASAAEAYIFIGLASVDVTSIDDFYTSTYIPPTTSLPTLSTASVSDVTTTGATFSGEVTTDGGAAVTDRGFVYATTANPTTSDTKVQDGSGAGAFAEPITGLSASTTYYVRAYAINSTGTSYGNEVSFTTNSPNTPPTATSVTFSGTLQVGQTLTGNYTYSDSDSDSESGSTYTWYRADDASGSNKTAISGGTNQTYTLVTADEGKYISFEVTPSDGTDAGTASQSSPQGPVNPQQLSSQTVFDWETATDNGTSITQTVNGITATVTNASTNIDLVYGEGFAGSSGVVIYNPSPNQDSSITVSFSQAVDLKSIFALDADASVGSTWTFTPNGGSNSPVSEPIPANLGKTVDLNWTNINSVTITSSQGNESFALDNVTLALPCTSPDVPTVTATSTTVCDGNVATLNISGDLNDATKWFIYSGSCGGTSLGSTNGSTFTVSPNAPSTTYYIRGEGGCVTPGTCGSITINVLPQEDPSFSYAAAAYCVNSSDPTPTISGVTGGTFSSSTGLSINASTGAVDLSASTPGTYTVTYTTPGTCSDYSNVSLTINALDNASFSYAAAAYCVNSSDPTPTVSGVSGGTFSSTTGLSINASTGAVDLSASTPGTYTVTYTTSGTCSNSSNVSLTINALDDASFSYAAAAYCADDSDPTPTITGATGGTFSSTTGLSINTSTGAVDLSASTPGTYTVTYTTSGTCSNSSNASIKVANLSVSAKVDANVSCNGGGNGNITIELTGGTSPFEYVINGTTYSGFPDPTLAISGLQAGTYPINVTDANGCTATTSVTITEPVALTASATVDANVSCNGGNDGTATASGTGGTASYTYLWDANAGNQTTATATGLAAGTYTVTITDANGCTDTASATITEPVTLTASATVDANVSCNAGNDGTATASGTGGTASYTYLWDANAGNQTTATATGLAAGTYTVTITDANGCTDTASATITEPVTLTASATVDANVSCNGGNDGTATASGSGGTASYTYLWDANAGNQTTATATGLAAGTYIVTITDANGCTDTASVTITEPVTLTASATVDANVSCNGGGNGNITIELTGGTSPFEYVINSTTYSNFPDPTLAISGLQAGTYPINVTDANGCTATTSVTITEPVALTASATVDANVSCNGGNDGTATASGTGGTASYTYLWDANAGNQTTATATGLAAGTYTVTITDANGCTDTASATITEPVTLTASATVDANVSCNAGNDGTATASGTGGTASYTYLWDVNAGNQTTATATGLAAGTYTVTITDANGCTDTASVTITEPMTLTASATVDANVSCNGGNDGTATASGSGGTASYTYLWAANAGNQTTATATGLPAGTYTVTITDANGCTDTASATITEPVTLTASATVDANVSCNGGGNGNITIELTGGTSPFEYVINGTTYSGFPDPTLAISGLQAGTYPINVTDANGCTATTSVTITEPVALTASVTVDANVSCNGGNDGTATASGTGGTAVYTYLWNDTDAQTTATATGLPAGTYTVTITDANGCTDTASATITEPVTLTASATVDANVSCNAGENGQATVSAVGGTAPYTYLWDDTDAQTTATATGLPAGTYTVTITDANGCTDTASVTITEPVALTASATVDANVSCNGGNDGTATASGSGGTASYTYLWDANAGNQTTATATGLAAGTYTVTITDANGCTDTASATITEPVTLTASATVDANVSCNGGGNGNITIELTGGTSPFEYVINGTTYSNFPDPTLAISALQAGTYPINVTDANGCTATTSVTITEPVALTASVTVDANVSCNGGNDGTATASGTGGTAVYTYLWDANAGNQTTATATGLPAGTYTVTITDANGCTDTASATITEPVTLTASATVDANVSCNAGENGQATVSAVGGTAPYTYLWDDTDAQTTATATGLPAGTYTVTITDANGCTDTASATITEPVTLTASATVDANVSCNGGNDGTATLNLTGGTAPFDYTLNGITYEDVPDPTFTFNNIPAGNHTVFIADANGCTTTASVVIEIIDNTAPLALAKDIAVTLDANGQASITASDLDDGSSDNCGVASLVIDQTQFSCATLGENTVTLTVTDTNGNVSTATSVVTVSGCTQQGITLEDKTFTYDGTAHVLAVTNLPADATVSYTNNGKIDTGIYTVEAVVTRPYHLDLMLSGTLTIKKAAQSITFAAIPAKQLEADVAFQLEAQADSGLPVSYTYSYSSTEAPAAVSESGYVTLYSSGEVQITAMQEGNANYEAAAPVTRTLSITSEDAFVYKVIINGQEYDNPEQEIYYLIDCNDGTTSVPVVIDTEANALVSPAREFAVNTPTPGIYRQDVQVTSQDGSSQETYRIVVEKRFNFEDIIIQKFNNVLLVNNNPETNGGYEFTTFEWYKNGKLVGTGPYYSAGDNANDMLDPNAEYRAKMTTADGTVLQTCNTTLKTRSAYGIVLVPNPVPAGSQLTLTANFPKEELKDMEIMIFSTNGVLLKQTRVSGATNRIDLPFSIASGAYIFTCTTTKGRRESVSFLVK
ncbi:beta strand repeat-containing protein [Leeuwenhoekiella polynyae]|uniref:beta strand repeat-containing protein n=1 Tax=Leeuwenhoekiella polynyae TaxID=1550906 RepID=UPI0036412346